MEVPQSQCSNKVDDVPVVQVVVRISWKVRQIQFIARVRGHSSCAVTVFFFSSVAMKGFFGLFGHFSRSSGVIEGSGGGADAGSFSQVSGHQSCACKLISFSRIVRVWTDTCVNVESKTTTTTILRHG